MSEIAAYSGLFGAAFFAATIFPAQSETVLAALLMGGQFSPWLLILAASTGNILGSIVNWLLGRGIDRLHDKKWFPLKPAMREKAQKWYARYGRWSLLLSWVPIIGDPLTIAAGIMREDFYVFVLLVGVVKTGRYLVLAAIVLGLM